MQASFDTANPYGAIRQPPAHIPVLEGKNDPADAAAAADFARILNGPAPASAPANSALPEKEEPHGFLDFLKAVIDIINPLQHIPVISAIYRHMTGDEINPMAKLIGDSLYGGPIGGAVALADIAYEKATGRDVGETVIAAFTGNKPATAIAQNMDKVSPAAGKNGAVDINDIVWNDPPSAPPALLAQNISSPHSSLSHPPAHAAGARGTEPAPRSPAPPVLPTKGTVPTFLPPTALKVDSTTVLQAQGAPADTARTAVPPGLVASRMMEALDKYADMGRLPYEPMASATY